MVATQQKTAEEGMGNDDADDDDVVGVMVVREARSYTSDIMLTDGCKRKN